MHAVLLERIVTNFKRWEKGMTICKLNSCPKCRGSTYLERDEYGFRLVCRHCGWHRDLPASKPLPRVKDLDADREAVPDGCSVSLTCFQCPLPDCLYQAPATRQSWLWDQSALALLVHPQPRLGSRLPPSRLLPRQRAALSRD